MDMNRILLKGYHKPYPPLNSNSCHKTGTEFRPYNKVYKMQPPQYNRSVKLNSSRSSADIGLPGVQFMLNPLSGNIGKIISALILLFIYSVCIYQVIERVKHYFSYPTAIDVISEHRQLLDFPTISICSWYPFEDDKELYNLRNMTCGNCSKEEIEKIDVFDLLPNISTDKIWSLATFDKSRLSRYQFVCNRYTNRNCHLYLQMEEVYTFLGVCLSLKLSQQINYDGGYTGVILDVRTKIKNRIYWQHTVLLHEVPDELPLILLKNSGVPFYHQFETDVTFLIKEVTARCMIRCLLLVFIITGVEASLPLTGVFPPFLQYMGTLVCGYNTSSPAGDIKHHLLLLAFALESVFTAAVICACNLHVGLVLQRPWSNAATASSVWTMHAETWNRRANSLSAAVLVGSAIHCVCYVPMALQLFYSVIAEQTSHGWTHALSVALLLAGPFFNPLIYVVCNRHYRVCFWDSFLFVVKCGRIKPTPTIRPYGSHESVDRRLSNISTSSTLSWIPDQTVTRN